MGEEVLINSILCNFNFVQLNVCSHIFLHLTWEPNDQSSSSDFEGDALLVVHADAGLRAAS